MPTADRRFGDSVEIAFKAAASRIRARAVMTVIVIGLIFGGVAFVLWRAAHSVLTGGMTPGDLIQFVFLSVMAAGSV